MIKLTIVIILSYIVGSIPSSLIISKLFANKDIRKYGSKNPGAANVYRTISPAAGALTAFLDMLKGAAAALLIAPLSYNMSLLNNETISFIAGSAAILGHIYSIFLKFKGGKGVATAAGVFFAITPIAAVISLIIFIFVATITKIFSLGSLTSSCLMPIILFSINKCLNIPIPNCSIIFSILIAFLILFAHRKNIERLIKGEENKI